MAFQCVPLNPDWTGTTKMDLQGVYRRKNGDLCTNLPLRRHIDWLKKGLEYVTLSDAASFAEAIPWIISKGLQPRDFICGIDGDGRQTCWNAQLYLADQKVVAADAEKDLAALIEQFGVETVEQVRGIKVPAHLRPQPVPVPAPEVSEVELKAEAKRRAKAAVS